MIFIMKNVHSTNTDQMVKQIASASWIKKKNENLTLGFIMFSF